MVSFSRIQFPRSHLVLEREDVKDPANTRSGQPEMMLFPQGWDQVRKNIVCCQEHGFLDHFICKHKELPTFLSTVSVSEPGCKNFLSKMEHSKELFITTVEPQTRPPVYGKPSSWALINEFMNTFWVYEILASVISLTMLAATYGILKHYNSTDVDAWSHSWQLNSLIGLLATIIQIAMAVPLASGISQLKWLWYRDVRKLTDLDRFDQSSRGPIGSVLLLFSRPFK
jgi:hypothetical protein